LIPDFAGVCALLQRYAIILLRKMGYIAIGWVVVYFLFQKMREVPADGGVNILTLFSLLVGAVAGLVSGWTMAPDAVEDSSMSGMVLWIILVVASVAPMWAVEGILKMITHWPMNMGGFMMLMAANLMALAAAVWNASAQE
jgi:hypothetical protein